MRAWICGAYGGPEVLSLEERPRPAPRRDEVLVRVRATTVSSGDRRIRAWDLPRGYATIGRLAFGVRRPRQPVLGSDFAGIVEAVGEGITEFTPGDAVFGMNGLAMGCHAEYVAVRARQAIAPKPAGLSFEDAVSLCFGGTTATCFLRRAELKAGETVLVVGASGAVGSAMVQLAKALGARVTGVTSARNADLVASLGADEVIDYGREGIAARGGSYDVIADTVGAHRFAECHPLLAPRGRFLAVSVGLWEEFARPVGGKRSIAGMARERARDVADLARLAQSGLLRPVIDRVYDFERLPLAHALADTGRKRGSVVVSVGGD